MDRRREYHWQGAEEAMGEGKPLYNIQFTIYNNNKINK